MTSTGLTRERVGGGLTAMAAVLLLGIVIVTVGYAQHSSVVLYVGLLITLAGVLTGTLQLLMRRRS
jgi:hypothetical protein